MATIDLPTTIVFVVMATFFFLGALRFKSKNNSGMMWFFVVIGGIFLLNAGMQIYQGYHPGFYP